MDTKATSTLVGILLTWLFCGCGGGGDSTTKPSKPILSIGAGQSKSISKIQAPNKGLLKINLDENPVYRIYSVDGQLLEGPKIVENFPFSIEIDGLKKNKAAVQGVLVLCLSTVNKQYHSFIPFEGPVADHQTPTAKDTFNLPWAGFSVYI